MPKQRSFKNYFLQPFLQAKLGLYNVALSTLFCVFLGWYFMFKLDEFADVVVSLADADEVVHGLITDYLREMA